MATPYTYNKTNLIALDTETTGVDWYDSMFALSVAWWRLDEIQSAYMDHRENWTGNMITYFSQGASEEHVYHNAKFDIQKIITCPHSMIVIEDYLRLSAPMIHDTQIMAYVLNSDRRVGLKELARVELGLETDEEEALKRYRREHKLTKADGYDKIPSSILKPYALKDAEFTLQLADLYIPQLIEQGLWDLYRHEVEMMLVCLQIEMKGIMTNRPYIHKQIMDLGHVIRSHAAAIANVCGDDFNPNSPKQIIDWFLTQGIHLPSTDKVSLSATNHPVAQAILRLREAKKLLNTYFIAMRDEPGDDDILHPGFRLQNTVTGRMASGGEQG
jgi:DNA polymerase I-like protein with 3'-5' exonuclease and polymerase domains